jgi:hypothetical protein
MEGWTADMGNSIGIGDDCGMAASPLIAAAILQWDIDRVGPKPAVSSRSK